MLGELYIIKNRINNKSYIGKTYRNINRRFAEHVLDSTKYNRPLSKAIRKYGAKNFEITSLGTYPQDILEIKEQEAIREYNTYHLGYNATLGGDGKRYLKYSDNEIIEAYTELKTVFDVANKLKIDGTTIRKILNNNNIEIVRPPRPSTSIAILDPYMEFNSFRDCAQFLKDCELTNAKDLGGIGTNIRRAIVEGKLYLGLQFSFLLTEQANGTGC
jgi:hypothetical protein